MSKSLSLDSKNTEKVYVFLKEICRVYSLLFMSDLRSQQPNCQMNPKSKIYVGSFISSSSDTIIGAKLGTKGLIGHIEAAACTGGTPAKISTWFPFIKLRII